MNLDLGKQHSDAIMVLDLIEEILHNTETPAKAAEKAAELLRELSGAKAVVVLTTDPSNLSTYQCLNITPKRRVKYLQLKTINHFYQHAREQSGFLHIDDIDCSSKQLYVDELKEHQLDNIVIGPLGKEEYFVGAIILLGVPEERHGKDSLLKSLEMLSNILSLIIKNSSYYKSVIDEEVRERKVAEEKVYRLKNQLLNIINSMPFSLYSIDQLNRITLYNRKGYLYSSTPIKNYETNLFDALPIMKHFEKDLRDSINNGEVAIIPNIKNSKNPKDIRYETITIFPINSDNDSSSVIIIQDETEQFLNELKLNHKSKMDAVGQLAGGVAHDFNNMLAGIVGAAELLKFPDFNLSQEGLKYIDLILRSVQRASDLTSKLLSFSRKEEFKFEKVDIEQIIHDTIAIFERTFNRNITITSNYKAKNSIVDGDSSALQNIFINLGINGSHAMSSGGNLTITAENIILDDIYCNSIPFDIKPGEFLKISFTDDGEGIPEKDLPKIFDPFFTTKKKGKGTGLGLSTAYALIRKHLGAISVYSEVGIGTTFHILLPCKPLKMDSNFEDRKPIRGSGTIMVVDDEVSIREVVKKKLERLGYKVIIAKNGIDGYETYRRMGDSIDLIIMDMIMPQMNGKESFLKIRELDKSAKVIFSSGFSSDNHHFNIDSLDSYGFIAKPYRDYELSKLIYDAINIKKSK